MRLTDILDPKCIKVPLAAADKYGAIEELVQVLADHADASDAKAVLKAVLEREATRTTGIGQGLAIPHGKSPAVSRLVMAVGKAATPIDFHSIDEKPVTLIVLLVSPPDKAGPHIQALARVSRLMTVEPFRRALEHAATPEEVFQAIVRQEEALSQNVAG